jgi:protein-disulfide isomerase-like protein with CxxC motif
MTTKPKTNLRQFPSTTKSHVAPVKMSKSAATEISLEDQMDATRVSQLTGVIFGISFQPFFKKQGFTMDQLAAAALSVATQHMNGISEAGAAAVAEYYTPKS